MPVYVFRYHEGADIKIDALFVIDKIQPFCVSSL